jgi:hypothetical protein
MGINFPNAPTVNQLYPQPPVAGVPVYRWDGQKWTTQGATATKTPVYTDGSTAMAAQLTLVTPPVNPTDAVAKSYVDTFAAPFDALAYNGMQINGSMDVSQANGTSAVTANGYILDGWNAAIAGSGGTMSAQQVTDAPPGYSNSLKVSITTANASPAVNDYCQIYTYIEGYRFARCAFGTSSASPVSIGFWVKANRPGTYSGALGNSASNRSYVFSFTINASATWQYITVTIPGDIGGTWLSGTSVGTTLHICIMAGANLQGSAGSWQAAGFLGATGTINGVAATTDYMQITGVVVLPGIELPSASRAPFIMRPAGQELAICKRYLEAPTIVNLIGYAAVTNIVRTGFQFITKRASPTITMTAANFMINSYGRNDPGVSTTMETIMSSWFGFSITIGGSVLRAGDGVSIICSTPIIIDARL